jgi:7,8-dihydropterin-6-yl-methyl-4-(beta-D-ribofuranosyl)aminobenzene 5'-phosphate synthase
VLLAGCSAAVPTTPAPTAAPSHSPTIAATRAAIVPAPTVYPLPADTAAGGRNAITVLYDNVAYDRRLQTDWGFSALVEYHGRTVLFDTGTSGKILLANMSALGVDPAAIEQVVLSHAHTDHIGGLTAFLAVSSRPPVYLLPTFGAAYKRSLRTLTEVIETSPGMEIAPGIFTTGVVRGGVAEQAVAILTSKGLIVITGCAHPGVDRMVKAAADLSGEPVYMVIGGFHLYDSSRAHISAVMAALRDMGVQKVAPSHCTGTAAIKMFADEWGEDFIPSGAGNVIALDGQAGG